MMMAPIWEDPITQEEYEGVARLVYKTGWKFSFGGKDFEEWVVKFDIGNEPSTVRVINNEFTQFIFKGKTQ
jgi:hypothetical protein